MTVLQEPVAKMGVFVVSCSCRVTDTLWLEVCVCVGHIRGGCSLPSSLGPFPCARGSALGALVMRV